MEIPLNSVLNISWERDFHESKSSLSDHVRSDSSLGYGARGFQIVCVKLMVNIISDPTLYFILGTIQFVFSLTNFHFT